MNEMSFVLHYMQMLTQNANNLILTIKHNVYQ